MSEARRRLPEGACWAIVLAAGESRRYGAPKLLETFAEKPLLGHVLEGILAARAAGALAGAIAVVGMESRLTELVRAAGCKVVPNRNPALGIASSLQMGFRELASGELTPSAQAALVVLGDQPCLRPAVIELLVAAWRRGEGDVIRPRYAEQPRVPGHPVLIDRSAWGLADELQGDVGLAPLLRRQPGLTILDVPGSNPDVDVPADLRALRDDSG